MMGTRYALPENGRTGAPSTCSDDSFTGSPNVRISPPSFPSYSTPIAMSIPGSNNRAEPPPPLPPPRYVPIEGPTVFDPRYGLPHEGFPEERQHREHYKLRDRSYDEGYYSNASSRTLNSPQFSMHHAYQPRPAAHEYDSSMLSRLNTCNSGGSNSSIRRTDNRSPTGSNPNRLPALGSGHSPLNSARSPLSSSAMDSTTNRPPPMQLPKLLSLPERPRGHQQLGDRYNKSPLRSGYHTGDYRSPLSSEITEEGDNSSSYARTWRSNSGSGSVRDDATASSTHGTRGGYDNREDDVDFPMDDTSSPMNSLSIDDKLDTDRDRRQKRRASSPPDESVLPTGSDMFLRRDVNRLTRGSPVPRLAPIPSSLSSTFSNLSAGGRSASTAYTSATSMTSMGSFGRSPVGPSPITPADSIASQSSMKEISARSSYNPTSSSMASSSYSLAPSPQGLYGSNAMDDSSRRSSLSWQGSMQQQQQQQQQQFQQRLPIDVAPIIRRETGYMMVQNPGEEHDSNSGSLAAKMQGFLMCECCPKKPKKFDTREALSAHEAEKQYRCQFCPNRFKNKNEAERHQNSLHLRRNSWSCSAMSSFERAFHDSPTRPGEADSCGYCGQDFPRTGAYTGQNSKRTRPEDWEVRAQHLQEVHKFRECNVAKKFWRADHFRQHLKHSHAGSSGKWTNLLENACMIDESPPSLSPR